MSEEESYAPGSVPWPLERVPESFSILDEVAGALAGPCVSVYDLTFFGGSTGAETRFGGGFESGGW